MKKTTTEASRLERLWRGQFGDAYIQRNLAAGEGRRRFWKRLLAQVEAAKILEVGCNVGGNLRWLAEFREPHNVWGVDINEHALQRVRQTLPDVNAVWSPARSLPFKDDWFDLAFTTGVLIHQPQEALPEVMAEVVRCARRYVLCGEYFAPSLVEVPYRGQKGALFKQDYGALYLRSFPALRLIDQGFLPKAEGGWDDVTWWLFEKGAKGRTARSSRRNRVARS